MSIIPESSNSYTKSVCIIIGVLLFLLGVGIGYLIARTTYPAPIIIEANERAVY